jgi:hypothetical protein
MTGPANDQPGPLRARLPWYLLGLAMLAWGIRGLLLHVPPKPLLHAGRLVVLDVGGHDALFAPACVLAGLLTGRFAPRVLRTPLRVGFGFAVVMVVLALPNITSEHRLRNPSVLPLDYERNLGFLLGMIAVGVLLSAGLQLARERRRSRARPPRA